MAPCLLEATAETAEPAEPERVVATVGSRVTAEPVGPPERMVLVARVARAETVAAVRSREPATCSVALVVPAVTQPLVRPVMAATVAPRLAMPL